MTFEIEILFINVIKKHKTNFFDNGLLMPELVTFENFHSASVIQNDGHWCLGKVSIYEIYIAPLQGNYSEALPAPSE